MCASDCACLCAHLCPLSACLLERQTRAEEEERGEAKCSETDSQRLLLLGLIPSRVSCKDLEL